MADNPYGAIKFGEFRKYMQNKRAKLKDQERLIESHASQEHPPIFANLSIYINGYTTPPQSELRRLIIEYGGDYQHYLMKSCVTHIVASNLTNAKMKEFRSYKVVKPEWVVESIQAKRLLPWSKYRVVPRNTDQSALPFAKTRDTHESNAERQNQEETLSQASPEETIEGSPIREESANVTPVHEHPIPTSPSNTDDDVTEQTTRAVSTEPRSPSGKDLNAALLANEWARENTTVNPNFIKKFYSSSRLHHLSTWKAELREIVRKMEQKFPDGSDPTGARKRQQLDGHRVVMHVDFDCFFASVGLLDRPHLRDKPVAVSHGRGIKGNSSSDIASCNYIAREYGIYNGMHIGAAKQKCPELQVIPYEFEKYRAISEAFYEILFSYADVIQAVSVDEALMEVASHVTQSNAGQEDALAREIRDTIRDATGCEASIGIGQNILLARLATKKAKPCGQFNTLNCDLSAFLAEQDVRDLPGVGYAMEEKLEELGVATLEQLSHVTLGELQRRFGPKQGQTLYNFARGIDKRPLNTERPRQSVSAEVNWGVRFETDDQVKSFVQGLSQEISERLKNIQKLAKNVTLKVLRRRLDAGEASKHLGCGECDSFSKSTTLAQATDDPEIIHQHVYAMLSTFRFHIEDIRGLGIQMQKLEDDGNKAQKAMQGILKFTRTSSKAPSEKLAPEMRPSPPPELPSASTTHVPPAMPPPAAPRFKMTVDKSVFDELPPNVQQELRATHDLIFTSASDPTDARPPAPRDIPSPPNMPPPQSSAAIRPPGTQGPLFSQMPELPPWSQLDPDSLLSLPSGMRQQVLEAYSAAAKNKRHTPELSVPQSPPPQVHPSPEAQPRPETHATRVPLPPPSPSPSPSPSRRGRKRKAVAGGAPPTTLTQLFGSTTPRTAAERLKKPERERMPWDCDFWSDLPPEMQREIMADYRRARAAEERRTGDAHFQQARNRLMDEPVPSVDLPSLDAPQLLGHRDIQGVRQALREWMAAFPVGPEQEDADVVHQYVMDLVRAKHLEQARLVLAFLVWLSDGKHATAWPQLVSTLKKDVLNEVEKLYHCKLGLE